MPEPSILNPQTTGMNRHQIEEYELLARDGHGWVLPRPDGTRAACGGPQVCRICALEKVAFSSTSRITVMEGFNVKPGDKLLLIAPPDMAERVSKQDIDHLREMLMRKFPETDITVMAGFTGVQIHRQEFDT